MNLSVYSSEEIVSPEIVVVLDDCLGVVPEEVERPFRVPHLQVLLPTHHSLAL